MSEYTYTDPDGDKLHVSPYRSMESLVQVDLYGDNWGIRIPNADVPTVAAELLKAAGQEATILPKSTSVVQEFADGSLRCGMTDTTSTASVGWARARAAELLALADHIESTAQREADAEKKLQERRDALATELSNGYGDYESAADGMQKAIDRIINLIDGK